MLHPIFHPSFLGLRSSLWSLSSLSPTAGVRAMFHWLIPQIPSTASTPTPFRRPVTSCLALLLLPPFRLSTSFLPISVSPLCSLPPSSFFFPRPYPVPVIFAVASRRSATSTANATAALNVFFTYFNNPSSTSSAPSESFALTTPSQQRVATGVGGRATRALSHSPAAR
jgi:hypothetical protein